MVEGEKEQRDVVGKGVVESEVAEDRKKATAEAVMLSIAGLGKRSGVSPPSFATNYIPVLSILLSLSSSLCFSSQGFISPFLIHSIQLYLSPLICFGLEPIAPPIGHLGLLFSGPSEVSRILRRTYNRN